MQAETKTYKLKTGIDAVHRAGLYIEAGKTIDLDPAFAQKHADVLEEAPASAKPKRGGA